MLKNFEIQHKFSYNFFFLLYNLTLNKHFNYGQRPNLQEYIIDVLFVFPPLSLVFPSICIILSNTYIIVTNYVIQHVISLEFRLAGIFILQPITRNPIKVMIRSTDVMYFI